MGRIRILWVIKSIGRGGAEILLLNAARLIDHEQFDVSCVFIEVRDGDLLRELEGAGVHCFNLSAGRGGLAGRLLALGGLVASGHWEIIHVHSPLPGSVARIASLWHGLSRPILVTTEHNSWASFNPLTKMVNAVTMHLDSCVLAVSEDTYQSMNIRIREKAEVVVQGVPLDTLRNHSIELSDRIEWKCPSGTPIITSVANFREQKDHRTLLHALKILQDQRFGFHAVFVGDGPLRDEITSEIARLDLTSRVEVLGSRRDVPRILLSSDLFVLSSKIEGGSPPIAVMEAFACGLPVVATAIPSISEGVEGTGAAELVEPRNAGALAGSIRGIIEDRDKWKTMASNALLAAERYDLVDVVKRLEHTYTCLHHRRR